MTDIPTTGANTASEGASDEASGSVREMAGAGVQTVKQEAASFAATAQDKATEQVEKHKETATETLGAFADAIRQAGEQLSQNDQSTAGHMVSQAAKGLETFTRSLEGKRPEELVEAVREFGRRNPTVIIAGSVLVGVALARFFKASAENEPQSAGSGAEGQSAAGGATPASLEGGTSTLSGGGRFSPEG